MNYSDTSKFIKDWYEKLNKKGGVKSGNKYSSNPKQEH